MKRKIWACMLVLCLVLAGCGKQGAENANKGNENKDKVEAQETSKTGVDAVGNTFTIPENLTKIGITPIPWASVVYSVDNSSERINLIHPSAKTAYEGSLLEKMDPKFGEINSSVISKDFSFNNEEVMGQGVQAMLIWDYQVPGKEQLDKMGVCPVMVQNETVDDLKKSLSAVGQLLGKEDRADSFIKAYDESYEYMQSKQEDVKKLPKVPVLYLRDGKLKIQGANNFIKEALDLAGAQNIIGDGKTITMEEVIAQDPQIILLSDFDPIVPDDLYENRLSGQDWSNVSAVKNKQVYKMPLGIYRWDAPGVETPLMMKYLAKIVQPQAFKDVHFNKEMKNFYKELYGYDLSKEDQAQVLRMKENANSKAIELD